VPPALGFLLGFLTRRWTAAVAAGVLSVAIALSGWVFGWTSDSETPALGGAIVLAVLLGVPFTGGACLGVAWARSPSRRDGRAG
jgi:uncharacterized membrane protein YphA (DoxX/SURF4 family)